MYNSDDFVSFDDLNIDWDFILEENLSSDDEWDGEEAIFQVDDNANSNFSPQDAKKESDPKKTKLSASYKCPVCSKILKSVSGFNSHTKRHGESCKASDHKVFAEVEPETLKEGSINKVPVAPKSKEKVLSTHIHVARVYTKEMMKNEFINYMKKALTQFQECPFQKVGNKFGFLIEAVVKNFDEGLKDQEEYSEYLCTKLWEALTTGDAAIGTIRREKMWTQYATVRMDAEFQKRGFNFISILCKETTFSKLAVVQVFNSFLRRLFEIMIKVRDDIDREDSSIPEIESHQVLPSEEQALHYVGGYICKSLCIKFKRRSHPKFQQYIKCVENFVHTSRDNELEASFLKATDKWTREVDRGGLKYINDNFFLFLRHIEMCTRKHFALESINNMLHMDIRQKVIDDLSVHPMIPHYWDKLSINLHTSEHKEELFSIIIKLFLTIRGHSFAKKVHEKYEKDKNVTLKSQKGLRKSLKF